MASSQASQDDSSSKYAHLLQPIRDLASNWDVNIADELEDYLVSARPLPPFVTLSLPQQRRSHPTHVIAGGAGGRQVLLRGRAILELRGG